ncbi:MAG: DUF72 domain-containing protein, partial [Zoogloea sp.]|nr:DUF72 domain-containing protein [Zoogloea sp.]
PERIQDVLGPIEKKNLYYRDMPAELLDELWLRFMLGIEPLRRAGKLGVVLFQFPPWFVPSSASFDHLAACADRLAGYQLAVEFRNKAWFEGDRPERVWQFEKEHGLAHVVVDEPQGFTSSIPALWEATSPAVAMVRLHGRNRDTWEQKGLNSSGERFNYLYSDEELNELSAAVLALARNVAAVHVLFGNSYADYAQRNAAEFQALLAGQSGAA